MKTSCGKLLNLADYFLYDVKLRPLAYSWSFLANQKARNAIVGAENLLNTIIPVQCFLRKLARLSVKLRAMYEMYEILQISLADVNGLKTYN